MTHGRTPLPQPKVSASRSRGLPTSTPAQGANCSPRKAASTAPRRITDEPASEVYEPDFRKTSKVPERHPSPTHLIQPKTTAIADMSQAPKRAKLPENTRPLRCNHTPRRPDDETLLVAGSSPARGTQIGPLTCGSTGATRRAKGAKSRFVQVIERKGDHVFGMFEANLRLRSSSRFSIDLGIGREIPRFLWFGRIRAMTAKSWPSARSAHWVVAKIGGTVGDHCNVDRAGGISTPRWCHPTGRPRTRCGRCLHCLGVRAHAGLVVLGPEHARKQPITRQCREVDNGNDRLTSQHWCSQSGR